MLCLFGFCSFCFVIGCLVILAWLSLTFFYAFNIVSIASPSISLSIHSNNSKMLFPSPTYTS